MGSVGVNYRLLVSDAVRFCTWLPTFYRNISLPSSRSDLLIPGTRGISEIVGWLNFSSLC